MNIFQIKKKVSKVETLMSDDTIEKLNKDQGQGGH